jgi:hypothetical protein
LANPALELFWLSTTTFVTSPRQHFPEGFFNSQAQCPARISSLIFSAAEQRPVASISSRICRRLIPKQ